MGRGCGCRLRQASVSASRRRWRRVRIRSGATYARRGRRCPPGAHAVAVGAARRLHCDARAGVAPQNSLRSLRSLRSTAAASQTTKRAARADPGAALLVATEIAPAGHRLPRVPPSWLARRRTPPPVQQRRARAGCSAPLRRREAQGSWPRAQRASSTDSSRLFERSERSERSEFCDGATRPSIAGESARSADRRSEALRPARTRLCRTDNCTNKRTRHDAHGPQTIPIRPIAITMTTPTARSCGCCVRRAARARRRGRSRGRPCRRSRRCG